MDRMAIISVEWSNIAYYLCMCNYLNRIELQRMRTFFWLNEITNIHFNSLKKFEI